MAEFIRTEEKVVNVSEPVTFENNTDSDFEVSTGIIFHKSGLYDVSIVGRRTIVSKVERTNAKERIGELIRCKDCKNWDKTWTNDFSPNYHYCPMVDGVRKDDFYCADAERREDG